MKFNYSTLLRGRDMFRVEVIAVVVYAVGYFTAVATVCHHLLRPVMGLLGP